MLKQSFSDALKGILIGLILSIFFSYLFSPELYLPLSPNSAVGTGCSCIMFTAHWSCSIVPSFGVQLGSSLASEVSSFKKTGASYGLL